MSKIRLVLLLVGVVLFFIIIGSTVVLNRPNLLPSVAKVFASKVVTGDYRPIQKIRVIGGSEFDIWLVGGERIHGFLEVKAPDGTGGEVAGAVQKLFNQSQNPMVKLLRRDGDAWRVEIYLKVNGQDVILSDYLEQNTMIWK